MLLQSSRTPTTNKDRQIRAARRSFHSCGVGRKQRLTCRYCNPWPCICPYFHKWIFPQTRDLTVGSESTGFPPIACSVLQQLIRILSLWAQSVIALAQSLRTPVSRPNAFGQDRTQPALVHLIQSRGGGPARAGYLIAQLSRMQAGLPREFYRTR